MTRDAWVWLSGFSVGLALGVLIVTLLYRAYVQWSKNEFEWWYEQSQKHLDLAYDCLKRAQAAERERDELRKAKDLTDA